MTAKLQRYSLGLIFIGIAVFLVWASLDIKIRGASFAVSPRFVPLVLSSTMLALAVWTAVADALKRQTPHTVLTLRSAALIVGFLGIVLAFILLMGTINFHLLTFAFLVAAFLYLGARSLPWILFGAGGLVAFQYGVFDFGFRIVFP